METLRTRFWLGMASIASLLALGTTTGVGQSKLENALKQYNATSVQGYIKPIADLFGANMNAGIFHSASIPETGFHLSFQLIGMAAVVGEDQKSYDIQLPPGFSVAPGTPLKTATVFGGAGTLFRDAPGGVLSGLEYRGSDGIINATLFPLAVPQLTVGYFYGTEATVRFIATPDIGDNKFPKTTLFGIGARHSISQYLTEFPVDLAGGFFYNSFTVGDLINFKSIAFGVQGGKQVSVLVLYGGLQIENSTMNLKYVTTDPLSPGNVDIDLKGDNKFRFTLGAGLSLGFFDVFADANFGAVTNFSGGIGFGF